MIAKSCPRCSSVTNIHASRNAELARRNMLACDWCGFSFHENEAIEIEMPGPPPVKKKRGRKDPGPALFIELETKA